MSETFAQLISSMVKSSSGRQFTVLVKLIRLLISIMTATFLNNYYFGHIEFEFTFQTAIQVLLSPGTIVWLLFFALLFFGIYPAFSALIVIIYRLINPPKDKLSRQNLSTARKGLQKTGFDQVLKTLSLEQLKEARVTLQAEFIDSETTSVETQGYILSVLLQYAFFYKTMLGDNVSLLCIFIISIVGILIFIFFFLPFGYKLMRNLIDDQFKKSIKDAETLQSSSQKITPSP